MSDKHGKGRSVFIVTAVVLLLLGALAAGIFVSWTIRQINQSADTSNKLPEDVTAAQQLLLEGKNAEATALVEQSLSDPQVSNEEKYLLYIQLGNAAAEKEDYQATIAAYEKAAAISETYEIVGKLGTYWQQVGDKQKAIDYYKKAIQLNPTDNPVRDSENFQWEQMIKMLGGQV